MKYVLAILLPPVAVLIYGKPMQAIINFFMLFLFWIPAATHALFIVNGYEADRRIEQIVDTINKRNEMP